MSSDSTVFSNYPTKPIGFGAGFVSGYAFKSENFCEVGIPVIKIKNIQNKIVSTADSQCVPEELITEKLRKFLLSDGDVLIAMTGQGSVGRVGRMQCLKHQGPVMNQRVGKFVANETSLHKDFLYYVVSSSFFEQQLFAMGAGSGQPNLSPDAILSLGIPYPPYVEQVGIAEILNTLDNRITLLRETNATLEAIAQALFKSWFVDFDPVRAKMEGRVPEGMDEATAALFPDGFEESELGIVPQGWQPRRLGDFIDLAYGKALKAGDREPGFIPVYGSGGITGWHSAALVSTPSVVIGRNGTVGSLYWESRPFFAIDTVFYVKSRLPLTYCYYLLQTLGLSDMNTDAAVPGLNRENVYRLKVPTCSQNLLSAFDSVVAPLRASIDQNFLQVELLINIRDTLLPRLISGQLRLPNVEPQLEAVAA